MKFSIPEIPTRLYIVLMFASGVIIGVTTIFDPVRSPGPVGLIFATCLIVGPLRYCYVVWRYPRISPRDEQFPSS